MALHQRQLVGEAEAFFAEVGAERVFMPILQPADPFLDMAGEDLRRRIYLTETDEGGMLCLRPEFTIPMCMMHLAERPTEPKAYSVCGQVFRQRRGAAEEFYQAGIEYLGDGDWIAADARALAEAWRLVARLAGGTPALTATLGDQAVFAAVLRALGLPEGWRLRLLRAFGENGAMEAALASLSGARTVTVSEDETVRALLDAGDEVALLAHIREAMARSGLSETVGRRPEEIAARLVDRAALAATRLSDEAMTTLRRFLSTRVPLMDGPDALSAFAAEHGLDLSERIALFAERLEAVRLTGLDPALVTYDAAFGRPLDYYTGMVFQIGFSSGKPLAAGGRYDRLLTLLGAPERIMGVGFAAWLDRIAATHREIAP